MARQFHLPKDQRMRLDPEKDTTKFRRMAWGKPALTLRGGEAFYHPSENKAFFHTNFRRMLKTPEYGDPRTFFGRRVDPPPSHTSFESIFYGLSNDKTSMVQLQDN